MHAYYFITENFFTLVFNISYFLDHSKITKIEAKTSTVKDAQTNDKITMTISKQETPTYINSCTTNILDNPDVNDFESGKTDIFTGSLLGECMDKEFMSSSNELKLTLKTTKSNGWMMEYVKIFASDGKIWMCKNSDNKWLDTDHFTEYSINCIPDSLGKKLKHCFDHLFGHSLAYFFFCFNLCDAAKKQLNNHLALFLRGLKTTYHIY